MRLNWANMPVRAELKMPVWTPGSYLIREYARHVQDFSGKDARGNDLTWQKTSKNTWQIDTKGAKQIVARYNVYANELTVRTNELNAEHAFFNNAALLMFPKDQIGAPSTLKVVPYGNWKIATGLPRVEGQTNTFLSAATLVPNKLMNRIGRRPYLSESCPKKGVDANCIIEYEAMSQPITKGDAPNSFLA
jgi:predicted metalloprotease with PDZ domain